MQIKPGVSVRGISNEILLAIFTATLLWLEYDAELVVTSCVEGKHKRGSAHYTGRAVDLRIWNLDEEEVPSVHFALKEKLGEEYDVILEKDHIHVEFDPKEKLQ